MFDEIRWAVGRVLRSPARLRFLLADGPRTLWNVLRFLRTTVPKAAAALARIEMAARLIPDDRLREQALVSVEDKAYHVAGGCILATFLPKERARRYIDIVAPLETIYDYLDNLCDRHPEVDPRAYPVLHRALADALDPSAPLGDYYAAGPDGDDGGYLAGHVLATQAALRRIDGYEDLVPMFARAVAFYTDLQTFKHLPAGQREPACVAWYERNRTAFPHLEWYEFACAAGSNFQVYVPLFTLLAGEARGANAAYDAYFPPVAALHILLDAFIDQAEDREHGELNFAQCYPDETALVAGATALVRRAQVGFATLPEPYRHRFLLSVMALFYLTHPKVEAQGLDRSALHLLGAFTT
jgi:tetraprenyl-beta-curcumene synthase